MNIIIRWQHSVCARVRIIIIIVRVCMEVIINEPIKHTPNRECNLYWDGSLYVVIVASIIINMIVVVPRCLFAGYGSQLNNNKYPLYNKASCIHICTAT